MNKKLTKSSYIITAFIMLMVLSLIYIDGNPYEKSIKIVVEKARLVREDTQMVSGEYTAFLFFNFVSLELRTIIKNKKSLIKAKLIKYPFQKKYKITFLRSN